VIGFFGGSGMEDEQDRRVMRFSVNSGGEKIRDTGKKRKQKHSLSKFTIPSLTPRAGAVAET